MPNTPFSEDTSLERERERVGREREEGDGMETAAIKESKGALPPLLPDFTCKRSNSVWKSFSLEDDLFDVNLDQQFSKIIWGLTLGVFLSWAISLWLVNSCFDLFFFIIVFQIYAGILYIKTTTIWRPSILSSSFWSGNAAELNLGCGRDTVYSTWQFTMFISWGRKISICFKLKYFHFWEKKLKYFRA